VAATHVGGRSRSAEDDEVVTRRPRGRRTFLSLRGNNTPTVSKLCRSVQNGEKRRGGGDY
jgi:hypothetical protein